MKMKRFLWNLFVVLAGVLCAQANETKDTLVLSSVSREIDLTTSLVQEKVTAVLQNKGDIPVNQFVYLVDPILADRASYIGVQVSYN